MTRTQFDREQVIEDSTRLFWQRGYCGSSMQQVFQATGLKPGSLYLAFGNKEGLYRAALEHYATQSRACVRQILDESPSVGSGICRILMGMVGESGSSDFCSCFLIKSQLELAAVGGELLQLVRGYLRDMENLYVEYLRRDFPREQAVLYAASLTIHVHGLRVYGYLGHPREALVAALRTGLPWLPWEPE